MVDFLQAFLFSTGMTGEEFSTVKNKLHQFTLTRCPTTPILFAVGTMSNHYFILFRSLIELLPLQVDTIT